MIRLCARYYSSRHRPRGCRVLDYATPETHLSVAKPQFLLGARMGLRYTNADPQYDDRLELQTILSMHAKAPDLRDQARFATFFANAVARAAKADKSGEFLHQNLYAEILLAPNLARALSIASSLPNAASVPPFVALHTLGRHAASPLDAHNALRQFEQWLPRLSAHYQPELTTLMLRMAQRHLVDLVPIVVELFFRHAPRLATHPAVINELLWQIARYGRRWSLVDTPVLSQAQEIVVQRGGVDKIDVKGLVALAYIKHFRHPDAAREVLRALLPEVASRTPAERARELPYAAGPLLIEILTSESPQSALLLVDRATAHEPAVWSALALFLKRSQTLDAKVAVNLWTSLVSRSAVRGKNAVRPTGLLLELVVSAIPDLATKKTILATAQRLGLRVTPSVVAALMRVSTVGDLVAAKQMFPAFANKTLVLEQVLQTESRVDPARVWSTYTQLNPPGAVGGRPPSRRALQSLCRAAWDTGLKWDNLFAAQRALREVKLWVRGAAAPADDVLRVYPTNELLYAYVVMAGRAGFTAELLNFMSWMDAIQHQPSRRVLLALCHYSPQGPVLLKMGQAVPGWPTYDEFAVYQSQLEPWAA